MPEQCIIRIPFKSIVIDKSFNARTTYDEDNLEQLRNSILHSGLLQPIGVSPARNNSAKGKQLGTNEYHLVYGYRRYFALSKIREKDEDAYADLNVVINEGNTLELQERNFKENLERENLKPFEVAIRIKTMVESGLEQREIAARLCRPQSWVSSHYKLVMKLGPTAWESYKTGELTREQALHIADLPEEAQDDIVTAVVEADTRTEARNIAKKASKEKGTRRQYANKGRPTAKNLTQAVADASFEALSTTAPKVQTSFFNGVAAGLRIALGDIEFDKLSNAEMYGDLDYAKIKTSAKK